MVCLGADPLPQSDSDHVVGQPKVENGEFAIANDGTFSIYLSPGVTMSSVYITGMRFSMSPKDSNSNSSPASVGGSQGPSPSNAGTSITINPTGSSSIPVGTAGSDNSTSLNIPLNSFSTIPPFSFGASTTGGFVQNTQGPGVSAAGQSASSPANAYIIVGSVLGATSAITILVIGVLYLRGRQPRRRKSPTMGPSTIVPFYDEGATENSLSRQETPLLAPKDLKPPLPPPVPQLVTRGEKKR